MARVPTYGSDDAGRVGRVSLTRNPQARQSVETTADAFGAGIGSKLAGLVRNASEGVQEVERKQEAEARRAEAEKEKIRQQNAANLRKLKAEVRAEGQARLDEAEQKIGMAEDEDQLQAATDELIELSHYDPYLTSMTPEEREITVRRRASKAYSAYASRIEEPRAIADFAERYKGTMDYDDYTRMLAGVRPAIEAEQADNDAAAVLDKHIDYTNHNAEDNGKAPPPGNIQALVTDIIIPKYEGTATVVDSNGAKVRMGVNLAHNPGVDLAKLTPQSVAKLYEEKYWKPIAGENIPPNMQLAALDMSIMAGPAQTKKLLKQANGDLDKFTALRQQFLAGLIKQNPAKYAKYAKSWANRVADADRWGQNVAGGSDGSLKGDKAAALARLEVQAEAEGWSPRRLKLAQQGVNTRYQQMKTQAEAVKEESEDTILTYLRDNDPQSIADALKDPTFREAYNALGPKGQNWADDQIAKDSKVQTNENNMARTMELLGKSATSPQQFLAETKDIARDRTLTLEQRARIMAARNQLMAPKKTGSEAKGPTAKTVIGTPTIQQALTDAGIRPNKKKGVHSSAYNMYYAELEQKLEDAKAANGGKLDLKQAEQIALGMFSARTVQDVTRVMGIPVHRSAPYQKGSKYRRPKERMTPQDRKDVLKYLQENNRPITEAEIERTWLAGQ